MSGIRLVVQGDDLGMCRAVNEGVVQAKTDGVLTQASVMAPTPWFAEGAAMARANGIATGLHVTFTCEWDYLRWSPLSPAPSLRRDDGTFPTTVEAAADGDPDDALQEVRAQAARAAACGLTLSYVDCHMGVSVKPAYGAISSELGLSFLYPGIDPCHSFDSTAMISVMSRHNADDRTAWFVEWLEQLGPGTHLAVSHPAVDTPELHAICDPEADNAMWATRIRIADSAALCAPEVRRTVEERGIELVAVADL